jgi:2-hydroxy-6-oxonona-2,4-dienedioate hydrolase/4,5:9,10-diseco-3-hydroxy-5,9,17-trioxoandrosta-1(10),2-diene-4-oate hydrolase
MTQNYYRDSGPSIDKMRNLLQSMVQNQLVITDEFVKMRFAASSQPEVVDLFTKHRPQTQELYSELESIRAKTLIVWGQDDRASGLDGALLLLRKLQDAQLHVFPNCGHWVHLDRSQDFNKLVISFC